MRGESPYLDEYYTDCPNCHCVSDQCNPCPVCGFFIDKQIEEDLKRSGYYG